MLELKGAITSPAYAGMTPLRSGTEPGTEPSARKPKRPIIARRPLLISLRRRLACRDASGRW
eukprot:2400649-Prymnesium_polylepis.1